MLCGQCALREMASGGADLHLTGQCRGGLGPQAQQGFLRRVSPAPDLGDTHLDQPQYRVTLPPPPPVTNTIQPANIPQAGTPICMQSAVEAAATSAVTRLPPRGSGHRGAMPLVAESHASELASYADSEHSADRAGEK